MMNVEILIFVFFAEGQINDDVMAPSHVTSSHCMFTFDKLQFKIRLIGLY